MATLDPKNNTKILRNFTISEDSSIDGLNIQEGEEVRFFYTSLAAPYLTLTNFTRQLGGKVDFGGVLTSGLPFDFIRAEMGPDSFRLFSGDDIVLNLGFAAGAITLSAFGGQRTLVVDGVGLTFNGVAGDTAIFNNTVLNTTVFTLDTLPPTSAGGVITVSDATDGQVLCYSDTAHWISVKTGLPVA